jgi:DNA-binding MarR family transcriptional regulator
LAAALNVSKPAITRALDRLQDDDFIKRETDSADRRSVIVRRMPKGVSYLGTISGYLNAASLDFSNMSSASGSRIRKS